MVETLDLDDKTRFESLLAFRILGHRAAESNTGFKISCGGRLRCESMGFNYPFLTKPELCRYRHWMLNHHRLVKKEELTVIHDYVRINWRKHCRQFIVFIRNVCDEHQTNGGKIHSVNISFRSISQFLGCKIVIFRDRNDRDTKELLEFVLSTLSQSAVDTSFPSKSLVWSGLNLNPQSRRWMICRYDISPPLKFKVRVTL